MAYLLIYARRLVHANLIFYNGGTMDIITSFRHVDPSEDIRRYVEEKLSRLQKYVETPLDIHVV
ncbi:hypothetical protein EG832_14365, partial [bacterium]|nr:hypothetical protein [bacterium]